MNNRLVIPVRGYKEERERERERERDSAVSTQQRESARSGSRRMTRQLPQRGTETVDPQQTW